MCCLSECHPGSVKNKSFFGWKNLFFFISLSHLIISHTKWSFSLLFFLTFLLILFLSCQFCTLFFLSSFCFYYVSHKNDKTPNLQLPAPFSTWQMSLFLHISVYIYVFYMAMSKTEPCT